MNKVFIAGVFAAAALCVACAHNTTQATTANQTITLDQALQKSAETRQKIKNAKTTYQSAKNATGDSSTSVDVVNATQKAVKEKIDTIKQQVKDEADAWKELAN